LLDWRQESDYSVFVGFEKDEVFPLIEQVENFNKLILEKIKLKQA
jgi:hypothetical protein